MKASSRHLADLLDEMVERHPDQPAVIFEDETLSYREFRDRAARVAKALYSLGVQRGDRVALLMTNRTEWPVTAFGALQVGATLVPLSTWYRQWDIDYALRHSGARVAIFMNEFRGNHYVDSVFGASPDSQTSSTDTLSLEKFPDLHHLVVFGRDDVPDGALAYDQMLALADNVSDEELATRRAALSPEDYCYILYTSGSTAAPKAVMFQHFGCCENGYSIGATMHFTKDDRLWLVASMAWALGSANGVSVVLAHGACMVLQEYMDPGKSLEVLEKSRATAVYVMPHIVNSLIEHPDFATRDLSSIRTGNTPGSKTDILTAIHNLAPQICTGYGATEMYGICSHTDSTESEELRSSSNGRPLPGMHVRVIDPDSGLELPVGQTGEFVVSGLVVPGYWNNEEANSKAFRDGAYYTGDLGYLGDDGRLHFVGRIKEIIRTGGINVQPAEVEAFFITHPAIKEIYVVGLPDPEKVEIVAAFIQLHPGVSLTEEELRQWAKARVASYKIPSRFVFVTEADITRTVTGKVNKRELPAILDKLAVQ